MRTHLAIAVTASLIGCSSEEPEPADIEPSFPAGFRWGAATAGFQVDMGCPTWSDDDCVDDASDWYQWVTDPGIVGDGGLHVSGEPVSAGPGMWETFEADADRMAADGLNAYRMSVEWSRLFPDAAAEDATSVDDLVPLANPDAVARYHEMFAALAERGIEPLVTMNHYTLPLWVHDGVACHDDLAACEASGWIDVDRIVPLIGLYAGYLGREFGADVDRWATLNEPYATALSGYLSPGEDRSSPPGISFDGPATTAVILNQIDGHAAMYDGMVAEDTVDADGDGVAAEVGIVMNMVAIEPADPANEQDVLGAEHMDYLYHRLYLDAFTTGAWDADLDGVAETTRPELADRLDFLGINYYNRVVVTGLPISLFGDVPLFDFLPEFSWDPYPEGLGTVTELGSSWGRPIFITENGTPEVYGDSGVQVLEGHLAALEATIDSGVDVRGYYYWSLVDNYEWNHGFGLRFGLYELDPDTKDRIARPVLERYRTIVADNDIALP